MDRLFRIPEAAREFTVSTPTVRRWVRLQKLDVVRLGPRSIRIRESDIAALVKKCVQPARKSDGQ